jgi:hypothetical protein
VQVHAGFAQAWLHAGFSSKVLGRLKKVMDEQGSDSPMPILLTGDQTLQLECYISRQARFNGCSRCTS